MTVVTQILNRMPSITQPHRKFLCAVFSTLLTVRGRANFLNLARHSALCEKTYRRRYRRRFDFLAFNRWAIKQAVSAAATPVFAQDARVCSQERQADLRFRPLLEWLCVTGRARVGSLRPSPCSMSNGSVHMLCPHSKRAPLPTAQTKQKRALTITCATCARPHPPSRRMSARASLMAFTPNAGFIDGVSALGFTAVSKLRLDANLRYLYTGTQTGRGRPKRFDGHVRLSDLTRFTAVSTTDAHITLYTAVVNHVTLGRDVRIVLVVNTRDASRPRMALLFATDQAMAATDIYRYYKARFHIEFVFRDAKQFAGFTECQARDKAALHFHFNAALATVNLTRLAAQAHDRKSSAHVFSMASWKQRAVNEHWLDLIISKLALDPMAVKSHPHYEYLRNYGVIAA